MSPPTGTVTFLFTDVEGSTRLWQDQPEPDAPRPGPPRRPPPRRPSRATAGASSSPAATPSAPPSPPPPTPSPPRCDAQRALCAEPWPTEAPLRVRMGLHTGEAEQRDGDYFGEAVSRAARLMSAAHGGQVLLSQAAADAAGDALPDGVTLRDLAAHRLKDLRQPEHVFSSATPTCPPTSRPCARSRRSPTTCPRRSPPSSAARRRWRPWATCWTASAW